MTKNKIFIKKAKALHSKAFETSVEMTGALSNQLTIESIDVQKLKKLLRYL